MIAALIALALGLADAEPVSVTPVNRADAAIPAADCLRQAKVALGGAVEGSDPRSREQVFREAEALFEHVIDRSPDSTHVQRNDARDFLRAIHLDLPPNRIPEKAVTLRTLVLLVTIEGESQKFDRKKFNDLSQKMKNKRDPKEFEKLVAQCTTKVSVKTAFTSEDEKYVKRKMDEAAALLFEWSRGKLALDVTIDKLPHRIAPTPDKPGRHGFWPPAPFTGPERGRPEEELLATLAGRHGPPPDVVVLLPKYEKGDDELPGPDDAAELGAHYAPLFGRTAIAHARLYTAPSEAASDGNVKISPMEERIVTRILLGVEPLLFANLGSANPDYRADATGRPPKAPDLLPDLGTKLKVGYQEHPPGRSLLREVLSNYLTHDMASAIVRPSRELDARRELVFSHVSSPPPGALFDGDLTTAFRFPKVGDAVNVELARPTTISAMTFIPDGGDAMPREIEVTYGDGAQSWRYTLTLERAPMKAQRVKLPAPVNLKTLDVKVLSIHGAGDGGGFREIVLD
ncbi:MAG: hypothetical protein HYR85_25770 [Planctomycetes bacterium]|nr:hypothetical protein [Planctomycetota bacterium]MBI3847710.1 hypothetical protein [Planctomycetota bacterium]